MLECFIGSDIVNDKLEIKWPWEMVWMETVDEFIDIIKTALPPDHCLQTHDLFPGIKWDRRPIFIIDDDTTGEYLLMDLERPKRGRNSSRKVPSITLLKTREEVAAVIEKDHQEAIAEIENSQPQIDAILTSPPKRENR